jgi:hypothetical protein
MSILSMYFTCRPFSVVTAERTTSRTRRFMKRH